MLARTFKTPAELNLSDAEFNALVTVLVMLERDELPWHSIHEFGEGNGFNMDRWPDAGYPAGEHCGSVGCIGYWVEKVGSIGLAGNIRSGERNKLYRLLFPQGTGTAYRDIMPEQAAEAMRNYLATGEANWAAVLA